LETASLTLTPDPIRPTRRGPDPTNPQLRPAFFGNWHKPVLLTISGTSQGDNLPGALDRGQVTGWAFDRGSR